MISVGRAVAWWRYEVVAMTAVITLLEIPHDFDLTEYAYMRSQVCNLLNVCGLKPESECSASADATAPDLWTSSAESLQSLRGVSLRVNTLIEKAICVSSASCKSGTMALA